MPSGLLVRERFWGLFDALREQPADGLLGLITRFRDDPRENKIDLGVGTYRNEAGVTPVMAAVKAAEGRLLEEQRTKSYLGPEGDQRFVDLLAAVAFGAGSAHAGRLTGVQTPGGGGALRLGAELVAAAWPGTRVWLGKPSWPNHRPIMDAARLATAGYRHLDPATQLADFDGILAMLSGATAGDVVLLHGCCHNPTGAGLDPAQWDVLAELLARKGLVPFVDLAYQGLGEGLEADAYGMRRVLNSAEEALVAYSCDKNFGLYRERTGALFVLCRNAAQAEVVRSNLLTLARVNWSMPPDHGAAAVRIVLESEELSVAWRTELEAMCGRINAVRNALAAACPGLAALSRQRGMFSLLPIGPDRIEALRRDHGIYMAASGRVNLAGLRTSDVQTFVDALASVNAWEQ